MKYDFIKEGNSFYPVSTEEIDKLQEILDFPIPDGLKEFWLTVGYGFISGSEYNINRVMDPLSTRDFRSREGDFEYAPDIEIYDECEDGKVIFFEGSESAYISIGQSEENKNAIFYYNVKIADSLKEFLEKIMIDDNYYVEMLN